MCQKQGQSQKIISLDSDLNIREVPIPGFQVLCFTIDFLARPSLQKCFWTYFFPVTLTTRRFGRLTSRPVTVVCFHGEASWEE